MPRFSSILISLALSVVAQSASDKTYDYIIAGAGVAGIIAAERLAESGASVLLLERGNASTYASGGRDTLPWNDTVTQYDVPGVRHYIKKNFNDTSEYCLDTADSSGCILGGGSMVNQLVFVPPQKIDFDDKWPVGWKWPNVASGAQRVHERNPGTITPSADGIHYDRSSYNVFQTFFSAQGWSSVDPIQNPDDKHAVYSFPPWNIKNGLTAGPVMTYLPSAQALSNFELQLHTKVIRIVRTGSLVTGVEVENSSGKRQIINVNKGGRVVLASGSLSTPRVLFNSGIGPVDQIETVSSGSNITNVTLPAESDWIILPVGQGLKDHPIVTISFNSSTPVQFLSTAAFISPNSSNVDLFDHSEGVLTQGYQRLTWWSSNKTASDGNTRYFQGTCYASATNTVSIKVYLTHGLTSTGVLGITSAGNTVYETQPYLNSPADREALGDFIDTLISWSRQPNSTLTYAGAATDTGATLIDVFSSGNHWVGTAKMGTDDGRVNNGSSVVDLNTKVYGTDNLFVVDGSMHPDLPTGNLQAIVMVAAEVAAQKILALPKVYSTPSSSSSSSSSHVSTSTTAKVTAGGKSSVTLSSPATVSSSHSNFKTSSTHQNSVLSALSSFKSSVRASLASATRKSSSTSCTTSTTVPVHRTLTTTAKHAISLESVETSSTKSSAKTSGKKSSSSTRKTTSSTKPSTHVTAKATTTSSIRRV